MSNKPVVSVVMITYNHEKYIKQAIEGVLIQQCSFDVELIISNDASPDNTDSIVKSIINSYQGKIRIRYYKLVQNKGVSKNFTWVLKQAQGKYIAICEGDDYWIDTNKLQKQVDFLERNDDVVICSTRFEIKKDNEIKKIKEETDMQYYSSNDLIHNNTIGTLTVLFLTQSEYPKFLIKCNFIDLCLWFYLLNKKRVAVLPDITARYRVHGGGIYTKLNQKQRIKKGFEDKVILMKNKVVKSTKFEFSLLKIYFKKSVINLIRALLFRPNAQLSISFLYIKMFFTTLYYFIKKIFNA